MNKKHDLLIQIYTEMLPDIREVGKQNGYAIAVHGSLRRDFDLIAVPWTEEAKSKEHLVSEIAKLLGLNERHTIMAKDEEIKPHGRSAYAIQLGFGMYIDLSIMPIISGVNQS